MQSARDRALFKVGFTKRKTKDRRAELNRVAGDDMKIVFTVSMPWARKCESLMLRRLRRDFFRKRDRRGTEWFRLRKGEDISKIAQRLEKVSKRVELVAKLKFSWTKGAERRLFRAVRSETVETVKGREEPAPAAD